MTPTHFLYLLHPPRAGFILDMSDDERAIMGQHQAWLAGLLGRGLLLAGPTLDGAFGVALFAGSDPAALAELVAGDPAVRAGLCRSALHPVYAGLLADSLRTAG